MGSYLGTDSEARIGVMTRVSASLPGSIYVQLQRQVNKNPDIFLSPETFPDIINFELLTFIEIYQECSIWNMPFNLYNNLLGKDHYCHFTDEKIEVLQRSLNHCIAKPKFELRESDFTALAFRHYVGCPSFNLLKIKVLTFS